MEKEDKIFDQFKSAADNAETKDFPGMENVWQRVEGKLDKKILKKENTLWKKIAVAACLLLVGTLGFQFFKNNQPEIKPTETVTSNDTIKKAVQENKDVVSAEPINPGIKEDADKILQKQISTSPQGHQIVTYNDDLKENKIGWTDSISVNRSYFSAPEAAKSESNALGYLSFKPKMEEAKDVEMMMDKRGKISYERKEEPLVVIDDKLTKKNIKDIEFEESDSLVVLNDPLYIINGVEYTEKEVFGPNPTSPYTPLNKQEIEALTILQDEKAVEIYGKKGKKGVVIITTKNGKPVSASKKAK
ncbi:MAG: hypothetical protein M0D53_14240 [Flavobacterium sp. JAD_PAG50586_2]|nr:MAG: hypothetical protein M0D53_14240 [Flavobacterium sp. JAD_PAG50586_2]